MFENSREPIALHWPVIELAPVPGRPILPVMSARLMIACAVFTPWWLWLTPIVHQNETRDRSWIRRGRVANRVGAQSRLAGHALDVVLADEGGEVVEAARVRLDIGPVDPARSGSADSRCRRGASDRSWAGPASGVTRPSPSRCAGDRRR